MPARLTWWIIPAVMVVLVRVVTLPMDETLPTTAPVPPAAAPLAEPASPALLSVGPVVLRDASGLQSGPVWLSGSDSLQLQLPAASAGERVNFTLRRQPVDLTAEPWLQGRLRVPDDAALRLLSVQPGRYAVEISWLAAAGEQRVAGVVTAPGSFDLR